MARTAAATKTAPVRSRSRALNVSAPAEASAQDVNKTLQPLLQTYAQANSDKNRGTREEKAAREALNKAMVALNVEHFDAKVMVDNDIVAFNADIAESKADTIDCDAVLKLLKGDMKTFMGLVSITKDKLEAALGKNAVIMCTKTVTKPAALSVTKIK